MTQRFVTMRASARFHPEPDDLSDQVPLLGRRFDEVLVICTHDDLADPHFRDWLLMSVHCRLNLGRHPHLEVRP